MVVLPVTRLLNTRSAAVAAAAYTSDSPVRPSCGWGLCCVQLHSAGALSCQLSNYYLVGRCCTFGLCYCSGWVTSEAGVDYAGWTMMMIMLRELLQVLTSQGVGLHLLSVILAAKHLTTTMQNIFESYGSFNHSVGWPRHWCKYNFNGVGDGSGGGVCGDACIANNSTLMTYDEIITGVSHQTHNNCIPSLSQFPPSTL